MQTTEPGEKTQQGFEGPARERAFLANGIILGPGLGKMNNVLMSRDEERAVLMECAGLMKFSKTSQAPKRLKSTITNLSM